MKFYIIYNRFYNLQEDEMFIGGIESYLRELYYVISEIDDKIDIVFIQKSKMDFEVEVSILDSKPKAKIVGLSYKGSEPSDNKFLSKVKDLIEEESVVIWGTDQLSIPIKKRGVKTIAIQHGIGFDVVPKSSSIRTIFMKIFGMNIYKWLQRYRALRLIERSDYKVMVDYNFLNWYRTFRSITDYTKYKVIPNFSREYYSNGRLEIRNSTNDRIKVLFARRFVERRGVTLFLAVANRILTEFDDVDFTFAGSGPYLDDIKLLKDRFKNRITITKYDYTESLNFHSKYDIAVVPSVGSEGTSLSLLEAMAAGCAVVATNIGGMSNIIIDHNNGLLVSPSESEIHAALTKLIIDTELRNKLSRNAVTSVNNSFSYNKWRTDWQNFIKGVINCD